jgi:hypothetical protein
MLPAASAAAALAQLHNHKLDSDWESELVSYCSGFSCMRKMFIANFSGLDVRH